MNNRDTITKANPATYCKVIFVEGNTDASLVRKLTKCFLDFSDYQIIDYQGITRLKERLDIFYTEVSSFNDHPLLKKIYITIDADYNAQQAFDTIIQYLKELNAQYQPETLPIPDSMNSFAKIGKIELGVYVLPNNSDQGCLESLLLKTAKHPELRDITEMCADEVIKYHGNSLSATFSQKEYMRYLLYIDGIRVSCANDYKQGMENGLDFESPKLNDLTNFLR